MNPKSSLPEDRTVEQRRRDRRSEMLDKFCEEQEALVASSLGMMNDLHKLQDAMDRLTAENNDLKERINTLGVDYDYAKNIASKSNDELKNVQSQLESKTTALLSALSKLDAANANIAKLNAFISGEEWKQTRSLKVAEDEAKRLESNHEHAKDVIDQLTKTLALANKRLQEANSNENHLARKTIDLYNTNQKLNTQIADLTKQIEELKKPSTKSPEFNTPRSPEGDIDIDKLRPEAALQLVNLLKKDLAEFNNRPFYKKLVEAPKVLAAISRFINNIGQDNLDTAPPHTPNTPSSK